MSRPLDSLVETGGPFALLDGNRTTNTQAQSLTPSAERRAPTDPRMGG